MTPRRRAPRAFVAFPRHPVSGRQFRVSAHTARELASYLERIKGLREELRLGMRSEDDVDRLLRRLVHGPITLERAALAYIGRPHLAPNTIRRVKSFLARTGKPLVRRELAELAAGLLDGWIDGLIARRMAPSSIATSWRTLRAVVRYATLRGWIGASPWGTWRPVLRGGGDRTMREALRNLGELVELLAAARALDAQGAPGFGEVTAKIAACVLLGLRRGELAGLRWSDIDWNAAAITIARQYVSGLIKNKRPVTLQAPALLPFLQEHRERLVGDQLFDGNGPVFPQRLYSAPGRPRAYSQGDCLTIPALRSVVAAAGLPSPGLWSTHSLRDSFVTLEASSPKHAGDLRSLAERSRHASLSSLSRYLRSRSREPAPPGFGLPDSLPAAPVALLPPTATKKTPPGEGGPAGR